MWRLASATGFKIFHTFLNILFLSKTLRINRMKFEKSFLYIPEGISQISKLQTEELGLIINLEVRQWEASLRREESYNFVK